MQETRETQVQSLHQEDPLEVAWQPTPVFLPGEFHGQRSLAGYSPWSCKESDTVEQLSFSGLTPFPGTGLRPDIAKTIGVILFP